MYPGRVLIVLFLLSVSLFSQTKKYPNWFLNPDTIGCEKISVGYANKSYYKDSSLAQAKRNGIISFARNKKVAIKGEHGFWSTAIGTISMGQKIQEIYDSSLTSHSKSFQIVKHFTDGNMTVVLLGNEKCEINSSLILNQAEKPVWLDKLPVEEGYSFAVGSSESFYYEASSWINAERNARLNLAKQVSIQIRSLSKKENSMSKDINTEDYSVVLHDVKIQNRWYDEENKLFHILVKMANKN